MFLDLFLKVTNYFEGKAQKFYYVKGKRFKEIRLLGEGGFGYVYLVENDNAERFALKLINITSQSSLEKVRFELSLWHDLSSESCHTIKLNDYEIFDVSKEGCIARALCVMEYIKDGNLLDYIYSHETQPTEKEIINIARQACIFLKHIHSKDPQITHRDIKPDNILMNGSNIKICDFGSCTDQIYEISKINKKLRHNYFSEFEKYSTLIYRPPEMIDTFSEATVNNKTDMWMLGCTLFYFAYKKHPFQNAQKLAIINCAYQFPNMQFTYSEVLQDFIRMLLNPNPVSRLSAEECLDLIDNWEGTSAISLSPEVIEIKSIQTGISLGQENTSKVKENDSEEFDFS